MRIVEYKCDLCGKRVSHVTHIFMRRLISVWYRKDHICEACAVDFESWRETRIIAAGKEEA